MNWQTAMVPGYAPDGKPVLSVLAKKTYLLQSEKIVPAGKQFPLNISDTPSDPSNPLYSETVTESDLVAFKQNTDIVVHAKAHSPKGKKAYFLDCEIVIGPVNKKIRVFGHRKIESRLIGGIKFTCPVPFEKQETGWAHTYGGVARLKKGIFYPFPPNPIGTGFNLKGGIQDYSQIKVPCCEDPDFPVEPQDLILRRFSDWKKAPKPVSFGWTKPTFFPRFTFAGVFPELSGASGADYKINPQLPALDFRFYQGASEGLCDCLLQGIEHVKLIYMDPQQPVFEFDLPDDKPVISLFVGNSCIELTPVLQTLFIDKESSSLFMVWRGSMQYNWKEMTGKSLPRFRVV